MEVAEMLSEVCFFKVFNDIDLFKMPELLCSLCFWNLY